MAVLFLLAALLQEPVSSTLYGSRFLTGEVGGSVTHQCFYSITPANKHDRKYWCKTAKSGTCYTIISTTGYTSKDHVGRVSLKDIPQNGTFTVTMTELKKNDTGTYRCGIGTTNSDLYVRLNLTVLADAGTLGPTEIIWGELRGSVTESSGAFKILINDLKKEDSGLYRCGTGRLSGQDSPWMVALRVTTASTLPKRPKFLSGTVGGSLSVKCHYDPKGNYEKKYLCRWEEARCSLLVDADGFVHESYKGRIQIASTDQENGTYTVVMSHLREEDAGWYWCGAKNGHTEHTSSVKLLIQKAASSPPTQRSSTALMCTTGTATETTSTLLPTARPGTFVTSPSGIYHESSSGDSRLLPVVLPALILLIVITIAILILTKIKLQKKMEINLGAKTFSDNRGEEGSAAGNLEAAPIRDGLNPVKEETMEEASKKCRNAGQTLANVDGNFLELALQASSPLVEDNKTKF
ncbi:PREDICTED: polymeric immunoglobulin receptor-like [Leptosomus discolor]|uniref:polymeric immunoglobulin receptor-like n=1 Tax=Leptosomus discolor TaxID=188344 RepID=UPI00052278F9|nr:PREDICTED: polymeric immunoglobulin receptor-like [Leptosomus discolor]